LARKDIIAGLLLLALAGGYLLMTRRIPESSLSDAVGAAGLPNALCAALAVLAALLVAKGLIAARKSAPSASAPSAPTPPAPDAADGEEEATIARALGFVLIGIGYMIVAPIVGYAPGVALLVVAIALYERERLSAKLLAVAAGGGVGFWLVFVKLLGTEQPTAAFWG